MDKPKTLREWGGLKCRTTRPIQNGLGTLKEGSLVVVDARYPTATGLHVETETCKKCGVSWRCSRLRPDDLIPLKRIAPCRPPRKRS